ncbi:hypothetical protein VYU27_005905, partial [Nannochloropsis oceanica]
MSTVKGCVLREAFFSTAHTGTGTGSEGGSDETFEMVKVSVAVFGSMVAVSGSIAYGVHHFDRNMAATEIKYIEDKAATEMVRIEDMAATEMVRLQNKAATDIARIEGERRLSEERLRAEVELYKYDLGPRISYLYSSTSALKR